ncbi:MAG: FkbM family methyltransferase [Pseudomonadota bacterium]
MTGAQRAQAVNSDAGLSDDRAAFGAYALPSALESLRQFGQGLGRGPVARRACSIIRRVVSAGRAGPFDIEPFPGQAARLYPRDNLSEKRVFGGAQFWDWAERAALGRAVRASDEPVYFVDAGANAGLYTLAVRSEARGKPLKVLAIEPDPENLKRLAFNVRASGAQDDVTIAEVALGDREGQATIAVNHANRGELTLVEDGTRVALRPLLAVALWAGFPRIDALKIDIEGMEAPVLRHFLDNAPEALWPGLVILEARRGEVTDALSMLISAGYAIEERTQMNVVLTAPSRRAETRMDGEHGQA